MDKIAFKIFADITITDSDLKIPKGDLGANSTAISTVLELAFGALGSIAFIVMVYAGMKFVLSRGNADAVAKARNTIVYATIGLILSILSFAIVRFILRRFM